MTNRCIKCTLPSNFPGVKLNAYGICQHCETYNSAEELASKERAKFELFKLLNNTKNTYPNAQYHCVVALSGGKDSSYTLIKLAEEWGLRCLAITVDNGFLSEQAIKNIHNLCDKVGVDFILFKPQFNFMKSLYKEGLSSTSSSKAMIKRASDLCSNCINLINQVMLKEALARSIPLIAGGYIAGQVPKHSSIMTLHLHTLKSFSQNGASNHSYGPTEADFNQYQCGESISILNPFLAIEYNENSIINELTNIGWQKPTDTGAHSSNCRINDLGIINHQNKYGFHPYELEIAEQVRSGNLEREKAIEKLTSEINLIRVNEIQETLDS